MRITANTDNLIITASFPQKAICIKIHCQCSLAKKLLAMWTFESARAERASLWLKSDAILDSAWHFDLILGCRCFLEQHGTNMQTSGLSKKSRQQGGLVVHFWYLIVDLLPFHPGRPSARGESRIKLKKQRNIMNAPIQPAAEISSQLSELLMPAAWISLATAARVIIQ